MPYRVAADVLAQMFPVGAGNDAETLRCHSLTIGERLRDQATAQPDTAAAAIAVTLDSTFIRSCEEGERHLEVRVGNVETEAGGRQVFAAVAKAETDIKALIRRSLDAVGRGEDTVLTAFTDGCSGLRRILAAKIGTLPVLGAAWYNKPDPTFADALAVVRRILWAEEAVCPILWRDDFPTWRSQAPTAEKPRPLQERLAELMSYAA